MKPFTIQNIKNMTRKVLEGNPGSQEVARNLGALETILIMEGKLELSSPLPKQEITYTERKYGGLFGKKVEKTRTETYKMVILRLVSDLINELESE